MKLAAIFSAALACATVPLREQECYSSLSDYYLGNKKPYCNYSEKPPKLFKNTYIVKAQGNNIKAVYIGEVDGDGYCFIEMHPYSQNTQGSRLTSFCTFGSGTLDACIWEDKDSSVVLQLRSENPSGCRGISWDRLEGTFEQAKFKFVRMTESNDDGYLEAAERVATSRKKIFSF